MAVRIIIHVTAVNIIHNNVCPTNCGEAVGAIYHIHILYFNIGNVSTIFSSNNLSFVYTDEEFMQT